MVQFINFLCLCNKNIEIDSEDDDDDNDEDLIFKRVGNFLISKLDYFL